MERRHFLTSVLTVALCSGALANDKSVAPIQVKPCKDQPESVVEVTGEEWAVVRFVLVYMDCLWPGWRYEERGEEDMANRIKDTLKNSEPVLVSVESPEAKIACFKSFKVVTKLGAL